MASKNKLVFLLLLLCFSLFSAELLLRVFDSTGAPIDSVIIRGDIHERTSLERAVPAEYSGPAYRVGVYFTDAPDIELFTLLEPMDVADYADQAGCAHVAATALDASGSTWADSCDTANFAWFADSARISENAFLAIWADSATVTNWRRIRIRWIRSMMIMTVTAVPIIMNRPFHIPI